MLKDNDVELAINAHHDIANLIEQFKKVVRPGCVRYGCIILSSTYGVGGENDIHFNWHRQDIDIMRFGFPLLIYGKKVTHNGTFKYQWLHLRRFAKYKPEITKALELAPELFREKTKAIELKMAQKRRNKRSHIIAIMTKYGDK